RLARPGRSEQQHALPRLDVEIEIRESGSQSTGVPPAPAAGAHSSARSRSLARCHGHGQTAAVLSRPAANLLSAPVFASPRTASHESRPARTTPETTAEKK